MYIYTNMEKNFFVQFPFSSYIYINWLNSRLNIDYLIEYKKKKLYKIVP